MMNSNTTNLQELAIIGAGNVASHIINGFVPYYRRITVFNRNIERARSLCQNIPSCEASDLSALAPDNTSVDFSRYDYIIISVTDNAIAEIASRLSHKINALKGKRPIVVHTSGTTPLSVLNGIETTTGVVYPMQTFSQGATLDLSKIHLFIESSTSDLKPIHNLARQLSPYIQYLNSADRVKLHLSAVFACNFANHMWAIADDLLQSIDLKFADLRPLVEATFEKAFKMPPVEGQTGPAVRNDTKTIDTHLALLPDELKNIYSLISQSIIHRHEALRSGNKNQH